MVDDDPVQQAVLSALALEIAVHRAVLSALVAAWPDDEIIRIERDAFDVMGPLPTERRQAAIAHLRRIIRPMKGDR